MKKISFAYLDDYEKILLKSIIKILDKKKQFTIVENHDSDSERKIIFVNFNDRRKKIAAIISALYGICSAGGQEIENNKAKSIIVEYEKTILLLINFNFENENYLMALLSNKKNNLAQVLFIGNTFIKILQS